MAALRNPWEIARPEIAYDVKFGGHTESCTDADGRYRVRWIPDRVVCGVAYDTPIPGYRIGTANGIKIHASGKTLRGKRSRNALLAQADRP